MLQTFARLLPGKVESQFLRACVDPSAAGRKAWEAWRAGHILQETLERDGTGKKRLLPLLGYTLEQGRVSLDPADTPLLRAARLREQLRAEKIRPILAQALGALEQANVDIRLLKGAAISQTVYPNPDLRHTHDLDLLVRISDLPRAAHALRANDFTLTAEPTGIVNSDLRLVHSSGLPLVLHTTLFQSPRLSLPDDVIWAEGVSLNIENAAGRILSPELMLVHVLGHTFYNAARQVRMWVSDAYFLATHSPAFDWERVADLVVRANVALAVFLTLNWLHRALALPIPPFLLDELRTAASKASQSEYESALTLLRRNGQGGYRHWLQAAQNMQERLQVTRWVLRSYGKQD